jgi:hypothetical protein
MDQFTAGDRVVAINTNLTGPIAPPSDPDLHPFCFPDGVLREGQVYHVKSIYDANTQGQGIYLTGLRVLWGAIEVPWAASRFRKVDFTRSQQPKKRQKKLPQTRSLSADHPKTPPLPTPSCAPPLP